MADKNDHIVHKLSLELQVPSDEYARLLPAASRRAIDGLCEQLDEKFGDTFFHIDKLSVELDLHATAIPDFEKQLKKALCSKINRIDALDLKSREQKNGHEAIVARSAEEHQKALVVHFLRTGRLPWWGASAVRAKMENLLKKISAAEWIDTLREESKGHLLVFKRLAMQFSPVVVEAFIEKLAKLSPEADKIIMLFRELETFGHSLLPDAFKAAYSTTIKEIALRGLCLEKGSAEEYFIKEALLALADERTRNEPTYTIDKLGNQWKRWLHNSESVHTKFWLNKTEQISFQDSKQTESEFVKPDSKVHDKNLDNNKDGISVQCSGLILMHPFIPALFKNVGLLHQGSFRDNFTQERAVCMLHYLATGGEDFFEPQLALPKFLCNWPVHKPVNRFLALSENEKEECGSLLTQAIAYWEALKNTSPVGLRSEFISREGILREEAFGWTLYVEWKTKDILLEQLPWSLSPVKFKWMDKILTVQW